VIKSHKLIILLLILIVIIILILTGLLTIATHVNRYPFNAKSFNEFKKDILRENKKIQKVEAYFWTPSLCIYYTVKDNITENDIEQIFEKTAELIATEEFQKEFFEEYFKKYKHKESWRIYYPKVLIGFIGRNGKEIVQYETLYEESGEKGHYNNWSKWKFEKSGK